MKYTLAVLITLLVTGCSSNAIKPESAKGVDNKSPNC